MSPGTAYCFILSGRLGDFNKDFIKILVGLLERRTLKESKIMLGSNSDVVVLCSRKCMNINSPNDALEVLPTEQFIGGGVSLNLKDFFS